MLFSRTQILHLNFVASGAWHQASGVSTWRPTPEA